MIDLVTGKRTSSARPPETELLKHITSKQIARFWSKVRKTDGCWEYTGYLNPGGYGQIGINGRLWLTHRLSYVILRGPIPEGLVLDHLCRNRCCSNPDHLEPVTIQENFARGARPEPKTHCPKGHPWDEANTRIGKRGRECRACDAAKKRRRKALSKAHD